MIQEIAWLLQWTNGNQNGIRSPNLEGLQQCSVGRTTSNKKRPGEPPRKSLEKAANIDIHKILYTSHQN